MPPLTAPRFGRRSGFRGFAPAPVPASPPPSGEVMIYQNFDGASVPLNLGGDTLPQYYENQPLEGGQFTPSIDTGKKVAGASSLKMHLTTGTGLYAQFNPYGGPLNRIFARDYSADPAGWAFNTYNRMRYWFFDPADGEPEGTAGNTNYYMGTYCKYVTAFDQTSDEAGGGHFYHPFNVARGTWSLCTFCSHPGHRRGDPGSLDSGNLPYPTTATYGGSGDPDNTYYYFDTLTRWYISGDNAASPLPRDYWLDEIEFYQETHAENDEQVYGICASYTASTNRLLLTWNRPKSEGSTNHDVRYAFSNIHDLGYANATAAPGGTGIAPTGNDYNGMLYATTAIDVTGQSTIYFAIKPVNSSLYSTIALPLAYG